MHSIKNRMVPLIFCLGVLQGCAFMHSPAKEALGKDVKDTWTKAQAELPKPVAAARENYEGIHTRQLAALDDLKTVTRDSLLLQTAVGYDRTVEQHIGSLQKAAGISSATHPCKDVGGYCSFAESDFWPSYRAVRLALKNNRDIWASMNLSAQRAVGKALPSCDAWVDPDGKVKKLWVELSAKDAAILGELGPNASGLTDVCTKMVANQAKLKKLLQASAAEPVDPKQALKILAAPNAPSTEQREAALQVLFGTDTIPSQMQKVDELQGQLTALKKHAQEAKDAVDKAEAAGKEADEEEKKSPQTAGQKLESASREFAKAAEKVLAAEKQFPNNPFVKDVALVFKSESLTAFFKSLSKAAAGEAPPAGTGKAASTAILFANYFDKQTARFKATEQYGLATLALEEQLNAFEQQRNKHDIDVLEQRLKLAQQKLVVLETALQHYITADGHLQVFLKQYPGARLHDALMGSATFKQSCPAGVSEADPCYKKKEVLAPANTNARTSLWMGLGMYIQSATMYPHQFRQLTENEMALDRADRMAASELNLHVWDAVLTSNVNQLEAWSKYGITTDEFQKGLNNVFTALIAAGVLK